MASASKSLFKLYTSKNQLTQIGAHARSMSQQRKSFIGGLLDNIKDEFSKNKEMKDSIKKFRDEAQKLEQTDALKEARKKYRTIEDETDKSAKIIKEKLGEFTEKVKESDLTKKAYETTGTIFKKAQETATSIGKQTQELSNTAAMKKVTENVKAIRDEFDDATQLSKVRPYAAPEKLRKRSEFSAIQDDKVYESDTQTQTIVLHKDSKWFQNWQNFKDNNTYVNKLFDLKAKYDESDNLVIRASRAVTDRFSSIFGNMFKSTEMSEVLTEIVKMDPSFDTNEFIKFVQTDIIPNVLEAISRQELDVLKDWCTETAFNILSMPIVQTQNLKLKFNNRILEINNVDIAAGKMMEQGPVLILTFNSQQLIYITDSNNKVIEGSDEKIKRVTYVWALCRDQSILDPKSAWRVMEVSQLSQDLFV